MLTHCSDCDRLWREYVDTRAEHVRLQGGVQAAVAACDRTALRRLRPLARKAWSCRLLLRDHFRQHNTADHRKAAVANAANAVV